jgi:hypothetical protein
MMKTVLSSAMALLLLAGSAGAQDALVSFRCESPAQSEPFSIEISGSTVKLSGVGVLDGKFSLIRKNDQFYVFKNSRGQGGNISRSNGAVELYAVNAAAHKMTVSINGVCLKQE